MATINSPSLPGILPGIGFGTCKLTGPAALAAVEWALEAGYRHLDTAQFYGNEEEVVSPRIGTNEPEADSSFRSFVCVATTLVSLIQAKMGRKPEN